MITKQKLNNFYHEHKEVFALNITFSVLLCIAGTISYLAILWFAPKPVSVVQILLTLIAIQIGINVIFAVAIGVATLFEKLLEN